MEKIHRIQLERTATMLRTYAPELYPEVNQFGQVHFGRAAMECAAETIEQALESQAKADSVLSDYVVNMGKEAYEAYCRHTGWKSLATGADLPQWPALKDEIRQAWMVTAAWIIGRTMRLNGLDYLAPITNPSPV